ncbi:MAG: F510_1955 family glycosylhydrolase [Ornithinibacter sp.]
MTPTALPRPPRGGAATPRAGRRAAVALAGTGLALALTLAGCGADAESPTGITGTDSSAPAGPASSPPASSVPPAATSRPIGHIHGVGREPGTGIVVLATHAGLFRLDPAGPVPVGPVVDLMGFAVAPDGSYLASGHPGPGTDLEQPVGLIRSTDAGATWTALSRAGESDFHGLTAGQGVVAGFDGTLRFSTDGATWRSVSIPTEPHVLAASPEGGRVLATTRDGLLSTADGGSTWSTLTPPELLVAVDWADANTVVGVGTTGRLVLSEDAGSTWKSGPKELGESTSLDARVVDGTIEVVVVGGGGASLLSSTDLGATTTRLL